MVGERFLSGIGLVTPVFVTESNRRLSYFGNTARSVLAQDADFEWLIVDDGSTDPSTKGFLQRLADLDSRVRVFHRKRGPGDRATASNALNFGITEALRSRCSAICYLHSDDWLLEGSLRSRLECLDAGSDLAFAKELVIVHDDVHEKSPEVQVGGPDGSEMGISFPHHTLMWKREVLSEMMKQREGLLFDPKLSFGEDLDVTLFTRLFLEREGCTASCADAFSYVWLAYSAGNVTSGTRQYDQLRQVSYAFKKNGFSYRREVGLKKFLVAYAPEAIRDRLIRLLRRDGMPRSARPLGSCETWDATLYWFREALPSDVEEQLSGLL